MLVEINPIRTYKTKENAITAANKNFSHLRYFIHTHTDGRFFPVFIGEVALQNGVHFHFNVIG